MSDAGTGSLAGDGSSEQQSSVLVVEDEPNVADLYRSSIEGAGYDVDVASTTAEASTLLDADYQIALLDRRLPDGHGGDVLAEIRDRELDIRVGMVTAVEPDVDIVEMGFDLYLVKPLSNDELLDAVGTLESRHQYDDRLQRTASLASKRATLEAEKPRETLEGSEEYRALTEELAALDDELDDLTERFDTDDYRRLFREIGA